MEILRSNSSYISVNLLILGLMLWVSPAVAEDPATAYGTYGTGEGVIGVTETMPVDNPFDNVFHVNINGELCGNEKAWLVYELQGVADHTSVSRSINDQTAVGGYLVRGADDWSWQKERIDVHWLKQGDNIIRFTVPGNARHSYKVRNISLEIGAPGDAVERQMVINPSTAMEHFGDRAYLKGFVAGGQAMEARVIIEGENVPLINGEFEHILQREFSSDSPWPVTIEAVFPDGESLCRQVTFAGYQPAQYHYARRADVHFTEKLFPHNAEQHLSLGGAGLTAPAGALAGPAYLSITTLRPVDIPALDAGMVNVTRERGAFRFLPHGSAFDKPLSIRLPYDTALLPSGYEPEDIRTYYFNEKTHHWVPLHRDSVLEEQSGIRSFTTHFTDMINAIIKVPESPEVNAYNSTTMKGIKAANPTAAVNLMQPPQANNMGNANMSYPLSLPAGRNGMQPQLAITYNNGGGNSWMGLGWNLSVPMVSIDTRWGVPRYDGAKETETYTLNGQQLFPVAHRGELVGRTVEKVFYPRVEGAFQRIIRHGTGPENYWWEVTDKNGTRYTYGGSMNEGFVAGAVLRTEEEQDRGYVAQWCLREVRDLNGNFVRYHYKKVQDSGVGNGSGGVKGYELYCEKITYTGHGATEGKYSVHFYRDRDLGAPRRPDVTIDARLGFKKVTADLLRKVEVKFKGQNIRHYEFDYEEGAFFKTLLKNIKEFDAAGKPFTTHEMTYYDEVRPDGTTYAPFTNSIAWDPKNDNINTGLLTSKFSKEVSVLSGNQSTSGGFGMTVTVGIDDRKLTDKSLTVGGSFGASFSGTKGRTMLIDMNGDGLPDKVFEKDKKLYYRPNLSRQEAENVFGERIAIFNAQSFYRDGSTTINGGLEAHPGFGPVSAFIGFSTNRTTSETTTYFTDVNGDQLPDIVSDGRVLFNTIDPVSGEITYVNTSEGTLSPVVATAGPDEDIFGTTQEEIDEVIDQNPLHDMVRLWRVPFTGTIAIDAPVSLVDLGAPGADGVIVSIQRNGTQLWSTRIAAGDTAEKLPGGVSNLQVTQGDRIYFRVQSVENGEADLVNWSPVITYKEEDPEVTDANGKSLYCYSASEDFILTRPFQVVAPIDGTIRISGDFGKPVTTDDVQVEIIRETEAGVTIIELDTTYAWHQATKAAIALDRSVSAGDVFTFKVSAPTNVNWTALEWRPKLLYTASADPAVPEVIVGKDTLLQYYPVIEYSLYARELYTAASWVIEDKVDSIQVSPQIKFPADLPGGRNTATGEVTFSVKKRDTLLYKVSFPVRADGTELPDTVSIPVAFGDSLFLEYHTANEALAESVRSREVYLALPDTSYTVPGAVFTVYSKEEDFIFGPLYRHWGHFGYNGNRERATLPINERDLKLNDKLKQENDGSTISTPGELENADPYDPASDNFVFLYPDAARQVWNGFDEFTYLGAAAISSSRLGLDNIPVLGGRLETGTGVFAIGKKNRSTNRSVATGGGATGISSGSATVSSGSAEQLTDYIDLNGDRYPDLFTRKGVVFTNARGGYESEVRRDFHTGLVSETSTNGFGASVNGTFKMTPKAGETGGTPDESDASDAKVSGSLSVNGGSGTNTSQYSWTDINGDGLPDRLNANGKVALNLGYRLAAEEAWGQPEVQVSKSTNVGGGIGFSKGTGSESSSIAGGIGVSLSQNGIDRSLQDINGDGLVDDVLVNGGVKVKLNTGNGFKGEYRDWTGADDLSASSSTTESLNASFTGCIPIPPPPISVVKLCFNPSGHGGQGVSRDESRMSDIDGDGFPDYLRSSAEDKLAVKRSTIGRTNMLRTVRRPLGASFTLEYKREGNTFRQPNNVWTLSSVALYDGYSGDGVDTIRSAFAYENGFYDRHEREFYGFEKVITTTLDTEPAEATPYTLTTQTFHNDNYYEKGLLIDELMTDGEGNKYIEKVNAYTLKDVITGADLPDSFKASADGAAFPAMTVMEQLFYEGQPDAGKRTRMTYDYDRLGNMITYVDEGDEGEEDDLIATIAYHDVDDRYIKGIPRSIHVEGVDRTYRKREADIDRNTGNVTQIRQFLEGGEASVHDMGYDPFGNLEKVTRPENHKEERLSVTYEYDDEVNIYVTKASNSYGYSSEATYDVRFGQVLESVDLNGQKITYVLDDLGRVTRITGPYEQGRQEYTLAFQYHPGAEVPWALTQHYDPQHKGNDMETALFVDGLGRVLQTKKDGAIFREEGQPAQEKMIVSGRVRFDAFGRTVAAYYPVEEATGRQGRFNANFDTVDPTTTTYDVLNRALTVTLPDKAVTRTQYDFESDREGKRQFLTRTTDANGIVTEQFTDVRGRVTGVKNITSDGNVWTSFTYNAINEQVTATEDLGNTTFSEYDWFGRRTRRIHPDAGQTDYVYDLASNLTRLVTANLEEAGAAITYTYEFERLTDITYPLNPESNVHYTYGEAGADYNRAGRIVLQEDATGGQEFFYGPLGEVVRNKRTVVIPRNFARTFVTKWTYDTWNRLTSMVYPDGEKVTYRYNKGGLLKSMKGSRDACKTTYVRQLGYDKFEQRVFLEYGNKTKTRYSYEPDRRRLKHMVATTAAKRDFMDNTYTYDKVNNILGLKNNAAVPTRELIGGPSEYHYTYDDLYRLTSATGTFRGREEAHRYSLNMSYNSVGSILQKVQRHESTEGDDEGWEVEEETTYDLTYAYSTEQPHAPVRIGKEAYGYDANGNMTSRRQVTSGEQRKLHWDEENRLRVVYDDDDYHHYLYDASGERVIKGESEGQRIFVNGQWAAGSDDFDDYTIYVNPYLVLQEEGYSKHYFIEGQRIASFVGEEWEEHFSRSTALRKAGDNQVDYPAKTERLLDGMERHLAALGVEHPAMDRSQRPSKGGGSSGESEEDEKDEDEENEEEEEENEEGEEGEEENEEEEEGGCHGDDDEEGGLYFYHPDHLGSTSYITDASGEVTQHIEYMAFGEIFVEEGEDDDVFGDDEGVRYLFNAKELDEETGLYYMSSRYYDPVTSMWLRVDPRASEAGLVGWSPYHYSFNNPIIYNDPNGDCPPGVDCSNPLPQMQIRQNRASNLGPGNVRTPLGGTANSRPHHGHDLRAAVGTNVSSTMAGEVVSSYNSSSYGNTVVVKTNIHPEAQPDFIGPPREGGAPEDFLYVQYSHLDSRNVNVGDAVTQGQNIGTSGQTGNAQGQAAAEAHLHIQVGTELIAPGSSITGSSTINPNLVYDGVSFESADPTANQTNTSVIKTLTGNNGQQTRIYQQVGNQSQSGNSLLLNEVVVNGGDL